MKRVFSIEYPNELGEMWMNVDNLLICLNAYCKGIQFVVEDLTEDIETLAGRAKNAEYNFDVEHDALAELDD